MKNICLIYAHQDRTFPDRLIPRTEALRRKGAITARRYVVQPSHPAAKHRGRARYQPVIEPTASTAVRLSLAIAPRTRHGKGKCKKCTRYPSRVGHSPGTPDISGSAQTWRAGSIGCDEAWSRPGTLVGPIASGVSNLQYAAAMHAVRSWQCIGPVK